MSDEPPLHFGTLVGSLRKGSYNGAIARALSGLAPPGVTISPLGSIEAFPHYDADTQATGIPPAVSDMAERIRVADGVIIVTPEYNYSIPGVLKNALDWLSRVTPQPFAGKPVAIQTASPSANGGVRAQHHLRQTFVYLDALVLNKPEVMVGLVAGKVNPATLELTDTATRDVISKQLEAFTAFARRNRPDPAPVWPR